MVASSPKESMARILKSTVFKIFLFLDRWFSRKWTYSRTNPE
jgi:hypothetical protein